MIDKIKDKARELLRNKQIDLFIGYKRSSEGVCAAPCFIDTESACDVLIWDKYCVYNLATYLKELGGRKVGIVAKGCDIKSIIVLLQENQVKRENIFIIGVECAGVIDEKKEGFFAAKCGSCQVKVAQFCDILISDEEGKKNSKQDTRDEYEAVAELEKKSLEEKFKLWQEEFSRCIRCYACRQVCPMCYCPTCVADQGMPVWLSKANSFKGNFCWNITRAMHLAGRCIDCQECERACPVGIRLRDINKKIEKDIKEMFKYRAGQKIEQSPLLSCFDKNDPGEFIK